MGNWQERVLQEQDDLQVKAATLNNFITGPAFSELAKVNQSLMALQLDIMQAYISVLRARICTFKQQPEGK